MPNANATVDLVARDRRFNAVMARVQITMERVRERMEVVAATARRMLLIGAGFGTGITIAFGTFEQKMARVKALTSATDEEFTRLNHTARMLGRETVFSANQAAQAMSAFALQGFKTNQIIAAMPTTLNLAAVGQLDMEQAASIAAGALRGMKLEVHQLGRVVDNLAYAATNSATDIPMLGEALRAVGPVAKSAGASIEEAMAFIRAASDVMIQGSAAGTAYRNVLARLQKNSQEVKKRMTELGLSVKGADGSMKSMADIVDELNAALEEKDQVTRNAIIGDLAGLRSMAAFTEVLELGGETLRKYTQQQKESAGTADRIAKTQMDNIIDRFKILWSAITEAAIRLGETFIPTVEKLRTALNLLTDRFNDLDRTTVLWITKTGEIAAATAATAIGFAALTRGLIAFTTAMTPAVVQAHAFLAAETRMIWTAQGAAVAITGLTQATMATRVALAVTAVAANTAAIAIGVGLKASVGALVYAIVSLQMVMADARQKMRDLGKSGKDTADTLRELAEATRDYNKSDSEMSKAKAIESRIASLKQLEQHTIDAIDEAKELRDSWHYKTAGAVARDAVQDNLAAQQRRLTNFRNQRAAAESELEALRKLMDAKAAVEEADATLPPGSYKRQQLVEDMAAEMQKVKEATEILRAQEALRQEGVENLTDAEMGLLKASVEAKRVAEERAAAEADITTQIEENEIQLQILTGRLTEAEAAYTRARDAGLGYWEARKLETSEEALAAARAAERDKDQAKAIKDRIRSKQQVLSDEIKEIRTLERKGQLTQQEAAEAIRLAQARADERKELAGIIGLQDLAKRIQTAAYGRERSRGTGFAPAGMAAASVGASQQQVQATQQVQHQAKQQVAMLKDIKELLKDFKQHFRLVGLYG